MCISGGVNTAYSELYSTGAIPVAQHGLIGTQQNGRTCRQARCCLPIAIAWILIHFNSKQLRSMVQLLPRDMENIQTLVGIIYVQD